MDTNLVTTYIVSGFIRTGTSMMMRALTAAGLDPAVNTDRDKMNDRFGDDLYKPNPQGFYELSNQQYSKHNFPTGYFGKLIKVLYRNVAVMVPGRYHVVFMLRNPEEIAQSYEAFFEKPPPSILEDYQDAMQSMIEIISNRKDVVSIQPLYYRHVLENPDYCFCKLKALGWPIDIPKACSVVDPSLCRFRREKLYVES